VVAVDCPSGMNSDTGALDAQALKADLTVTFAGPKRGHFRFPGAAACGELVIADIGISSALPEVAAAPLDLATPALVRAWLPPRPPDGHKGTFGTAFIVAGSDRYWGAPGLAARGAFRVGAGLVALGVPPHLRPVLAGQLPEATYPPLPDRGVLAEASARIVRESAAGTSALLVGPGLGEAGAFMETLFPRPATGAGSGAAHLPPLVVDADGLNLLAGMGDWSRRLPDGSILTPHPGEMARLMGMKLSEVREADRVELARSKAAAWGHIVVLKGAYTVVAAPDGRSALLPFANPLLAVGGSGDVLAGAIVGLLAQGVAPYEAAVLGGYLHAAAGQAAAGQFGDVGLLASELADWLPVARARLLEAGGNAGIA
jgi:NAD(P)H-hydrate epimerase